MGVTMHSQQIGEKLEIASGIIDTPDSVEAALGRFFTHAWSSRLAST
jgi:hypothetical protein